MRVLCTCIVPVMELLGHGQVLSDLHAQHPML